MNKFQNMKIQKTSFLDKSFMKTLASAVRFGTTLVVENVESIDPVLNPILNKEIINIGPDEETITVLELSKLVANETGFS